MDAFNSHLTKINYAELNSFNIDTDYMYAVMLFGYVFDLKFGKVSLLIRILNERNTSANTSLFASEAKTVQQKLPIRKVRANYFFNNLSLTTCDLNIIIFRY
jgi:hypothetical protein